MRKNKGFTLLELLIAAAIIGSLAVFATVSFRKTSSDVRVQDAIARAKVVANAARRFVFDNPSVYGRIQVGTSSPMGEVTLPEVNRCPTSFEYPDLLDLQALIDCGYLEYRQYAREIRNGDTYSTNFDMYFDYYEGYESDPRRGPGNVCVQGNNAKITTVDKLCTDGESLYTP